MGKKHKKHHKSDRKLEDKPEKEPLKLVLKVGGHEASPDLYATESPHEERRHKHKKKKKKKSSEKDKDRVKRHYEEKIRKEDTDDFTPSQEEEEDDIYEPPTKKVSLRPPPSDEDLDEDDNEEEEEDNDTAVESPAPPRPSRVPRACTVKEDEHGILKQALLYIQKNLQSKDVNGFFAYPVSDVIAPGYSSIIPNPMDFSTMAAKIENDDYNNVLEYKKDFVLMCNNAMTYNRPETIYYKEAKKLLQRGARLLSKDKLLNMKRNLGFMGNITMEELGIDEPDDTGAVFEAIVLEEKEEKKRARARQNVGKFEALPDNLSAEEILAQAQAAARDAADMLTFRRPETKLSFLKRREDGTTSLTVLNSDNEGIVSETERVVNLGSLVGKLSTGTGTLAGFKEDKRNKTTPINYLSYGPFSSHAPMYDSSFSNVSKGESDLLLSTYGDEAGVQYAKSITKFVDTAHEDTIRLVDNLLDVLTKGQHTKTMKLLEQKHQEDEDKRATETSVTEEVSGGQEVMATDNTTDDDLQNKLNQTAALINELQQTQHDRLSQNPPPHLAHIPGPSDKEVQLAGKVTSELTELTKGVTPDDVTTLKSIRGAMGIAIKEEDGATGQSSPSQPIIVEEEEQMYSNHSNSNHGELQELVEQGTTELFTPGTEDPMVT